MSIRSDKRYEKAQNIAKLIEQIEQTTFALSTKIKMGSMLSGAKTHAKARTPALKID